MSDEMTTLPFGEGIEAVEGELTSIRRVRGDEFPISTADCFALAKLIQGLRADLGEERRCFNSMKGMAKTLMIDRQRARAEVRERAIAHDEDVTELHHLREKEEERARDLADALR